LVQPSTTHQTELLGHMLDFQTPEHLVSCGHSTYQSQVAGFEAYDLNTGDNSLLGMTNLTLTEGASGNVASLGNAGLTIDSSPSNGPKTTVTAGDLTINDFGNTAALLMTADGVTISIIGGSTNTIDPTSLLINDGVGNTTNLSNINLQISNGSDNLTLDNKLLQFGSSSTLNGITISNDITVEEPLISMTNSVGHANYLRFNELNADGHYCYSFKNNERFFKQHNPFSFKAHSLPDNSHIEKHYPFVFCENIIQLSLYSHDEYLDDDGDVGWSCIVSNYGAGDLIINIPSPSTWYSNLNGGQQPSPIYIRSWATCRITLVYSLVDGYVWAVSQF
jgi:hypothetical protein